MFERAKKIQSIMLRAGFVHAAEEFPIRAMLYSKRDFEFIERRWLSDAHKGRWNKLSNTA